MKVNAAAARATSRENVEEEPLRPSDGIRANILLAMQRWLRQCWNKNWSTTWRHWALERQTGGMQPR